MTGPRCPFCGSEHLNTEDFTCADCGTTVPDPRLFVPMKRRITTKQMRLYMAAYNSRMQQGR